MPIFRDNPHGHFNAKLDNAKEDLKAHERGQENKIRWAMGERQRELIARAQINSHRTVSVTLATVKWMKP